jgi:hypothetical protein
MVGIKNLVVCALMSQTYAYDPSLFPLRPNTAVVTCGSEGIGGRFVLGIIDVRDPACDAPGLSPVIQNWEAPMYHNEDGTPWTRDNLGSEVFGLALDDEPQPNIYVLPTTSYNLYPQTAPQEVWKLDGTTGAKTVLATITTGNGNGSLFPNKKLGLGQIAYHRTHKQLYVTSFADGWIYRLDLSGNVLSTFDPLLGGAGSVFDPAVDTTGPIGYSDRIWAVQVRYGESRLYYGTFNSPSSYNDVWSVKLDASGNFMPGSEQHEVSLSVTDSYKMPISDIAFSAAGDMLVAERTTTSVLNTGAHQSKAYRFNRNLVTNLWELNPVQYEVGGYGNGFNSAGGVDFADCVEEDQCNPENLTFVTSDAISFQSGNYLYGVQILPATGGGTADSYAVDFDGNTITCCEDKTTQGDVEIVRACADIKECTKENSSPCSEDSHCEYLDDDCLEGVCVQGCCQQEVVSTRKDGLGILQLEHTQAK